MSILETLWSGRYYPAEKGIPKDGECKELYDAAKVERERFGASLSPEAQEAYENYVSLTAAMNDISERDSFIKGFRLGVQLLLEALGDYNSPFPTIDE